MANNATEYVIDQQNADGSWDGVAGVWGVTEPELLAAILAVFKDNDQSGNYRMVSKVRTESVQVTVIG